MQEFTEEDVNAWKNNAVTKAFAKAAILSMEEAKWMLSNFFENDLIKFGRLQQ